MSLAQLLCVTSSQKKKKKKNLCADTNNKNQTKIVKSNAQQISLSIWESQKMRKKKKIYIYIYIWDSQKMGATASTTI